MKKSIILFILGFLLFQNVSNAKRLQSQKVDVDTPTKNAITVYPFSFVASHIQIGYERMTRKTQSIKFIGAYGYNAENPSYYTDFYIRNSGDDPYNRVGNNDYGVTMSSFTAFQFQVQYRFIFNIKQSPLNKFFMGPFAYGKSMTFNYDRQYYSVVTQNYVKESGKETINAFALGYIVGYQYRSQSGFVLEAYLGGGMSNSEVTNGGVIIPNPMVDSYKRGVFLHPGLAIGFQF